MNSEFTTMTEYLLIFVFFVFCVYSEASIRMQRDFSYPVVEDFEVYWNVPTFLCHKHGVHFEKYTRKFAITTNPDDQFRGERISILYDPGLFPAMMKTPKERRLLERNGGIPQLGNLTLHLNSFKEVVEKVVPEDFRGVGIIDFEAWRPIFRQNWNEQVMYKVMSKELERQHHPQWTEKKIELHAAQNFEDASRVFMENTLKLAKVLRPNSVWGYYAFPYCYNYRETKQPHCSETVEKENNRIQWLFDESTGLYPSLYMSHELSRDDQRKFVIGRLNEAWRVASRVSNSKVPLVFPYIWYKYYDSSDFLSEDDIYTALETTRKYKMGGAIIWGATENVSSKNKCLSLLEYLNTVLGPAVERVMKNKRKSEQTIQGFVHFPFIPLADSTVINMLNHSLHPTMTTTSPRRQERSTTTLSPRLQNYYAWVKNDQEEEEEEEQQQQQQQRQQRDEEYESSSPEV